MTDFIQLSCKACGAHEFDKNSMGVFTCKYCGAYVVLDNKNEKTSFTLSENSIEYKKIILFCANILINDYETPTDILNIKVVSIDANTVNNETTYTFNFEYKNESFFIKKNKNYVCEKRIPIAPKIKVPYFNKPNFFKFIFAISLFVFTTPIGIVYNLCKLMHIINQHNLKVKKIYDERQKTKKTSLENFIKLNNL